MKIKQIDDRMDRHNLKYGKKNWIPSLGKPRSPNLKKGEIYFYYLRVKLMYKDILFCSKLMKIFNFIKFGSLRKEDNFCRQKIIFLMLGNRYVCYLCFKNAFTFQNKKTRIECFAIWSRFYEKFKN